MTDLIKISFNPNLGDDAQTVNARDLHEFLEVKTRFNDWIKNRIEKYGFIEGQDFVTVTENLVSGGKRTEYHLSLDMAKELSMVENNAKGRQARQYFIDMEKQARAVVQVPDFTNPRALLTFAEAQIAAKEEAEAKYEAALPTLAAMERLEASEGAMNLTRAAKALDMPPRRFNQWLASLGWIFRNSNQGSWSAYEAKRRVGYLEHKPHTYTGTDGFEKTRDQVLVTAKGLAKLAKLKGGDAALALAA